MSVLDQVLADTSTGEDRIGRQAGPADPGVIKLLQDALARPKEKRGIRLPRMSNKQWEDEVRPAFTRAASQLDLLPLNWRDMQGRWYTVPREQEEKINRAPLSPEVRAAASAKARATKAANKAMREAAQKATETQRPAAPTTGTRRAAS
jgi:hypothetical protein